MGTKKGKVISRLRAAIRRKGYTLSTEKTYVHWAKRFIKYHDFKGEEEIKRSHIPLFLTHLAMDLCVSSATQNQALNAIVFLFREVLEIEVGDVSYPVVEHIIETWF